MYRILLSLVVNNPDGYNFDYLILSENPLTAVTIYHNPKCSKSRQTLALLEDNGIKPDIILYLESPPDAATLKDLLHQLNVDIRDIIRTSEDAYTEQNLSNDTLTQEDLIGAILATPKLLQRPIVVCNNQARIGRPPESVLEII